MPRASSGTRDNGSGLGEAEVVAMGRLEKGH